jgi:hypothetical protein
MKNQRDSTWIMKTCSSTGNLGRGTLPWIVIVQQSCAVACFSREYKRTNALRCMSGQTRTAFVTFEVPAASRRVYARGDYLVAILSTGSPPWRRERPARWWRKTGSAATHFDSFVRVSRFSYEHNTLREHERRS